MWYSSSPEYWIFPHIENHPKVVILFLYWSYIKSKGRVNMRFEKKALRILSPPSLFPLNIAPSIDLWPATSLPFSLTPTPSYLFDLSTLLLTWSYSKWLFWVHFLLESTCQGIYMGKSKSAHYFLYRQSLATKKIKREKRKKKGIWNKQHIWRFCWFTFWSKLLFLVIH